MNFNKIKNIILLLLVSALFLFSCGKAEQVELVGDENTEETTESTDEYGNVEEKTIVQSDVKLHGEISNSWSNKLNSKSEDVKVEAVDKILNSIDLDSADLECIYGDADSDLGIWSLYRNAAKDEMENYGIIIKYGDKRYNFASVHHGLNPNVDVNEDTNEIKIAAGIIEGTGTHAEMLYIFKPNSSGDMELVESIDPYDMQSKFREAITYDINGRKIKFKVNGRKVKEIEYLDDGVGALKGIGIGEQMYYEFDDNNNVKVKTTLGKEFSGNTSTIYEDMPTFSANVKISGKDYTLSNIKIDED